jgi:hypothetical protein
MTSEIYVLSRDWPTWVIAAVLLGLMLACNEAEFRIAPDP